MKKILLTLGFASATLFAAHAQVTPQTQEEQEQIPQEQQEDLPMEQEEQLPQQEQYPQEQPEQYGQQQQQDSMQNQAIQGQSIERLDTAALPQEVEQALSESDYQGASIENAYKLSGEAIDVLMDLNAYEIYPGQVGPETLYMIRVMKEDKPSILYLTEEGEMYATKDLDMSSTQN
ncbi:hypothetical protein [Catalinimonas niigatensis]|uniref:hypothetical protein n=1 Tax=Catalinimonas niigatensis TaxID=1397264 RepID=UPI0026664C6F|nr:hypothetical protein [Catalinimonas niigatensis]WPP49990.1 hypothetical protein PZB72_25330 [Catalinimonas niigatensis]